MVGASEDPDEDPTPTVAPSGAEEEVEILGLPSGMDFSQFLGFAEDSSRTKWTQYISPVASHQIYRLLG
jgi:hypothetical protein